MLSCVSVRRRLFVVACLALSLFVDVCRCCVLSVVWWLVLIDVGCGVFVDVGFVVCFCSLFVVRCVLVFAAVCDWCCCVVPLLLLVVACGLSLCVTCC